MIKFIYEFIVQDKQLFTSLVEKNITDNMIKNFFLFMEIPFFLLKLYTAYWINYIFIKRLLFYINNNV